jgi:hypothetical protein
MYDATGRLVRSVVDDEPHPATWNGRNHTSHPLAPARTSFASSPVGR